MKLTKNLTEKDLKNISKINIVYWDAYQKGKEVTYYEVLTPLKTKMRYEGKSIWKKGGKVVNVKNEKRYESFSLGLKRINAAVAFQTSPTPTNKYSVTYERI